MAEPGDTDLPKDTPGEDAGSRPEVDQDADVGFCTPASLEGSSRAATARPEPDVVPAPDPDVAKDIEPVPEPEPDFFVERAEAPIVAPLAARPDRIEAAYRPAAGSEASADAEPDGMMGLYTVYALILFAVPTFGVSAVIGLLAVIVRDVPVNPISASHHVFQVRTLWTAAVVAVLGVILLAVNVGVFVLFMLLLWVLVRGAWGSWKLKSRLPIPDPKTWLI